MYEVLLYGSIYSFSSSEFIRSLNEGNGEDLTVRVNSPGGEVTYGWGMIAKFKEYEGKKLVKVDGQAASMAAFFTLFADDVQAIEASKFIFHRAAYPSWIESDMTEDQKSFLNSVNKDLESAFRSKVDVDKFEEISGVTVKQMFALEARIDVTLTAKQAKQVGIVNKIVNLSIGEKQKINSEMARIAAHSEFEWKPFEISASEDNPQSNKNNHIMNISELKEKHPALHAQILQEGIQQGIEQERDRVGAWSAFIDIDTKAVKEGILEGKALSQTQMAELSLKATLQANAANLAKESVKNPETEGSEGKEGKEVSKVDAFAASVLEAAGVKPKTV